MTLRAIILPPHPIKHILLPILGMATRIRQVQHALADLVVLVSLRPGRRLLHVLIDKAPGRMGRVWTYVIDSLSVGIGGELEEDDVDDSHGYLFTCAWFIEV
jgi:hypothetical protein